MATATVPYSNPNSYQQWAEDLETYAGLPQTPQETAVISAWEQSENPVSQVGDYTGSGGFNALNTSLKTGSSGLEPGSSFIPVYPDVVTALSATWSTLSQSNYAPEKAALEAQSGPALVSALGSPGHVWGSSPSLVSEILGTGASTATSGGTGGGPATGAAAATEASLNANPFDLFGIPQTIAGDAASSLWSEVGPFIVKGILVVTGLGVIVLGLAKMTDAGEKIKTAAPELAAAAA
jgi:hypothetical protein